MVVETRSGCLWGRKMEISGVMEILCVSFGWWLYKGIVLPKLPELYTYDLHLSLYKMYLKREKKKNDC